MRTRDCYVASPMQGDDLIVVVDDDRSGVTTS